MNSLFFELTSSLAILNTSLMNSWTLQRRPQILRHVTIIRVSVGFEKKWEPFCFKVVEYFAYIFFCLIFNSYTFVKCAEDRRPLSDLIHCFLSLHPLTWEGPRSQFICNTSVDAEKSLITLELAHLNWQKEMSYWPFYVWEN